MSNEAKGQVDQSSAQSLAEKFQSVSDVVLGGGLGVAAFALDDSLNIAQSATPGAAGVVGIFAGLTISRVWKNSRAQKKEQEKQRKAEQQERLQDERFLKSVQEYVSELRQSTVAEDLADSLDRDVKAYKRGFLDLQDLKSSVKDTERQWRTRRPNKVTAPIH